MECTAVAYHADEGMKSSGLRKVSSRSIILLPRKTGYFTELTPAIKQLLPRASCALEDKGV